MYHVWVHAMLIPSLEQALVSVSALARALSFLARKHTPTNWFLSNRPKLAHLV